MLLLIRSTQKKDGDFLVNPITKCNVQVTYHDSSFTYKGANRVCIREQVYMCVGVCLCVCVRLLVSNNLVPVIA